MASVLFIIRIPYEEDFNSSIIEREIEPKSSYRSEGKEISQPEDNDYKDHQHKKITRVKCASGESKTVEAMLYNEKSDDTDVTPLTDQTPTDVEIINPPLNLPEVLQNELISLHVQGELWTVTKDKQFYQVEFLEKQGERVENILKRLTFVGIGKRQKSSVSIIPTSVHIEPQEIENTAVRSISQNDSTITSVEKETHPLLVENESIMDQFKKSIKSRLTVEQVVEGIRSKAVLTFDFVMFTILASVIASIGLVEDNAVVLVASMLVSPLMGPVLGATFGTVIKNKNLRNTGLKTELIGLIISVVVGFLFGLIYGPLGASWDGTKDIWPTKEMTGRGMTRSLWVGVLIALPSGAGVALSVLGGNTGSLVGVAISASLLVPPVNSDVEDDDDYQRVVRRAPAGTQNLHRYSSCLERHLSKDDENTTERKAERLQHTLRSLQTLYTQQSRKQEHQPYVGTIFSHFSSEPTEQEPTRSEPTKPRNNVREFHVVDPEKPHHTSVVRIHPPTDDSKKFSVTTETGV